MKVNLYYCGECRRFFPLGNRHVKHGHLLGNIDCELCGGYESAFLIRDINAESQNWFQRGIDSVFAFDEEFMRFVHANTDDTDKTFEEWVDGVEDVGLFRLDMDAVREVVKNHA